MATAAAAAAARNGRIAASRIFAPSGLRAAHSTRANQMGSKAESSYEDYIHAEHMYNLQAMKYRKLKMGVGVFGALAVGSFLPVFVVLHSNKKMGL